MYTWAHSAPLNNNNDHIMSFRLPGLRWQHREHTHRTGPKRLICLSLIMVSVVILILLEPQSTRAYPAATLNGFDLNGYQLRGNPIVLKGIPDNASGLTYNPETDSLFAVTNNPEQLFEISLDGRILRTISLHGFEDTEDVTYLGNGQLAILEERRRTIVIIDLPLDTNSLTLAHQRQLRMPGEGAENNGFEGLTINPLTKQLYIVNEKNPRQLWQVDGFADNTGSISISNPVDLEQKTYGNTDLSGVFFDTHSDNLLLLSHESKQLTSINMLGQVSSQLRLKRGYAGLTEDIAQPEGITIDSHNTLHILGEPNLLYQFRYTLTP